MTHPSPPLSWLRLERYLLGELSTQERAQVEDHLAHCPQSRDRLQQIRGDTRPLPRPLPAPRPAPIRRWGWGWGLSVVPLAIALALLVLRPLPQGPESVPPARIQVRGGEIALTLVRERAGQVQRSPKAFAEGDRFLARLTCPPGEGAGGWTLTAFQAGRRTVLGGGADLTCENQGALPTAFWLEGAHEVLICATLSERPPQRPSQADVCQRLSAAR